jgi:hypothetical protein
MPHRDRSADCFLGSHGTCRFARCDCACHIRDEWVPFTTTRDNGFGRFERWEKDEGGPYDEFRSEVGGWLLLAAARHALRRPR